MNCDQVFSILTRGPFPTGHASDHAVETHLVRCEDCRQFAGALRPDNSMDTEAMVAEESSGLPYYWGLAAVPGGESVISCALPEGRSRARRGRKKLTPQSRKSVARLTMGQLAVAVMMGAAFGLLLRVLGTIDAGMNQHEAAIAATPPIFQSRAAVPPDADNQLLAKLGATPACLERRMPRVVNDESDLDARPLVVQAAASGAQCCTECHNAQSPRLALTATTAKIVRSCQVCHLDPALSSVH